MYSTYITHRMLEEENKQLNANLERTKTELSAVSIELFKRACEAHDYAAREEGLQLLLRDKDREISELKQTCDAQNQHLKAVAAFASSVSDDEILGQSHTYAIT